MRRAHPEFDISLEYGEQREGEFGQVLAATGKAIEVKSDDMALETGNFFVELAQRDGRPSGLMLTQAEWQTIGFGEHRWFTLRTEFVRQLARRALAEGRYAKGGDNNNEGALIPVRWIVEP